MFNDLQNYINTKIDLVSKVEKKWLDIFRPDAKDLQNQVVIRLIDRIDEKCLATGQILYSTFYFEIFIVGDTKPSSTRDITSELYDQLGCNYSEVENETAIIMTKTYNHSFQFVEKNNKNVNKFKLDIKANKK